MAALGLIDDSRTCYEQINKGNKHISIEFYENLNNIIDNGKQRE